MPRPVGRLAPPPFWFLADPKYETEINPLVFAELPPEFCWAMVQGLLFRLEKRNADEAKWLRGRVPSLMSQFSVTQHHRGARAAGLELVCWLSATRRPRGPICDPVLLLRHHEIATAKLKGLQRTLSMKGDSVVKQQKVESALKDVCDEFRKSQPRCACEREPQVPSDLKAWLGKKRTVGNLIDHLLVCCHGLTENSLHRLLNEGSRLARPVYRWMDERFGPVKPQP